jgi:predicted dehydrogenase
MSTSLSRRSFLRQASLTGAGLSLAGFAIRADAKISPNEKLDVAVIGVANRGAADLQGVASENIVALCDVNDDYLRAAAQHHPGAKTYNDFRRIADQKGIDAVVVATPDHTHAVAAVAALKGGRHVYCEKPLTRTVSECRVVTDTARKNKLVTQIGTQIHAGNNYRRVVELVQTGAVGTIREVHVWVNVTYGGVELPKDKPPVPASLHYDLWLGPVAERPYSPAYLPGSWRNWWAFGGGGLGDFGCHYMDLPYWALDLKYPLTVEPVDGPPPHPESVPLWMIVRYGFPARGDKPPVQLTWYHGGKRPKLLDSLLNEDMPSYFKSGVMFVGEKGYLISDYDRHVLLPEKDFKDFVRPAPFIPKSIGHHKEWIEAIKTGGKTTCQFDYSGPLTETALLGNVAYRVGKKLEWDAQKLSATNCREADQFIQHHYRKGWTLG